MVLVENSIKLSGNPTKHTGLIRTFFRPSDDATLYQFNIPGNAFVSAVMREASDQLSAKAQDPKTSYLIKLLSETFKNQTKHFSKVIKDAIYKHGLSTNKDHFLYEVDGFGNGVFMDDANVPSLISLPLLGFIDQNDPIYLNTRKKVLSNDNPFYFSGKAASGVGGPHVGNSYRFIDRD
jgi:meiotically up-regulated gene 157 (Mug157) protein